MIVRLTTQVFSESVGKHLYTYHGHECHGTADLCIMMDKFFDLLNIKNPKSPNDKRFKWLINDFLSDISCPTEENFGRHWTARRRNEHPSLY